MLFSDWYAKRKEQQLEAAVAAAEKRGDSTQRLKAWASVS